MASEGCNFYEAWFKALDSDAAFQEPFTSRPHIDPDIWDLAERRAFAAGFLEQAGEVLKTNAFDPACDALHQIHDLMWKINSLCEGEEARRKLLDPAVRREIVSILKTCRELDLTVAGMHDRRSDRRINQSGKQLPVPASRNPAIFKRSL